MTDQGWAFRNIGNSIQSRFGTPAEECGNTSYYGWRSLGSNGVASAAALFYSSGSATLGYGNCHSSGTVNVFLYDKTNPAGVKLATARGLEKTKEVTFNFYPGAVLNISTTVGILKINFLNMDCNGN